MRQVYFMRRTDTGLLKIGSSVYPEHRAKQIAIDLKAPIELIVYTAGGYVEEKVLHATFADERVVGEWFRESARLLDLIDHVKRGGALPIRHGNTRAEAIIHRRLRGETLKAIGIDYGISRERVRQIAKAHTCCPTCRQPLPAPPTIDFDEIAPSPCRSDEAA